MQKNVVIGSTDKKYLFIVFIGGRFWCLHAVYTPEAGLAAVATVLSVPVTWRYAAGGLTVSVSPPGLASWNFMAASSAVSEEEAATSLEIWLEAAWQGEQLSVVIMPTVV